MNGQMMNFKAYNEQLKNMQEPILPSQLPKVSINLRELVRYAKKKGVKVMELTEEERQQFIK